MVCRNSCPWLTSRSGCVQNPLSHAQPTLLAFTEAGQARSLPKEAASRRGYWSISLSAVSIPKGQCQQTALTFGAVEMSVSGSARAAEFPAQGWGLVAAKPLIFLPAFEPLTASLQTLS